MIKLYEEEMKSARYQMKPATKKQLRQEIKELRRVGTMMSNLCYNLGQSHSSTATIDDHNKKSMYKLAREWDTIIRSEGWKSK